jgi:hypothetical protein
VFNTCKADIWKLLTDEKERDMVACSEKCPKGSDGKPNPICVLGKCGKAAVECLLDETCRHVVECVPEALTACSKSAFECVMSSSGVCRDNIKCLGSGLAECSAPGVNMLTDTKIADLITCAGSKCPHPVKGLDSPVVVPAANVGASSAPMDAISQLLCIEAKCPLKLPKILMDQDSKDLLTCMGKMDFSPVWECLGDNKCQNALGCWVKPLETCSSSVWQVLTDKTERSRIETGAACLRSCQTQHTDNFVDAAFCVLDQCSAGLLDCYHDEKCSSAVKCLPETAVECAMPTLEHYLQEELFQKASKALAHGAEFCGRAAVEMLRDQNVADAVRCASQCTHAPAESKAFVVV